jgi:hypothetical protein
MADPSIWLRALQWTWDNWDKITKRLKKLRGWFRRGGDRGQPGILILGAGGVGKTTLGKLLAGEYDLLRDPPGQYRESVAVEHYSLPDSPGVEVVVPPGQKHRRAATWSELLKTIGQGKYRGIILMSAYGYHSPTGAYKEHELYKGDKEKFVDAFLADRRTEEIAILKDLAAVLKANPGRMWLLSVIAKQDLWYPKRAAAIKHYTEGDYAREVAAIVAQDPPQFRHEFVFVSLVISNFITAAGERLRPNVEGYDQAAQVETLRGLFEVVDGLREWEVNNVSDPRT